MSNLARSLLVALFVLSSLDADASPVGPSPIVNGTPTGDYPAVVAIMRDGKRHCTGTLITRRVVVTAAHCVVARGQLSVYLGPGPDIDPGVVIQAADARPHPGFDPATLVNDIAVVLLEHEAPVAPIPIFGGFWDPSFIGRDVELVGFGAIDGRQPGPWLKRVGTARLVSYEPTTLTFTADPASTCSGDSGGPAFMRIDGDLVLVGITSFGDRACAIDPTDTRADAYMATFLGPYIAAQTRMARSVGESCRSSEQCIERQCQDASQSLYATYCTRPCVRNDQCPGQMVCGEGICTYEDGGPAAPGAACDQNEQCASGICATVENDPDADRVCADWCAMTVTEVCSQSEVCLENLGVPGTFVCGPITPLSAGCASVLPWTPATPALFVVMVAVFLLVRSRTRGAGARHHRRRRDPRS